MILTIVLLYLSLFLHRQVHDREWVQVQRGGGVWRHGQCDGQLRPAHRGRGHAAGADRGGGGELYIFCCAIVVVGTGAVGIGIDIGRLSVI